jgi:hypothetical protein
MDKLSEVARILDDCLTNETLKRLASGVIADRDINGEDLKRKFFVSLLEHAGEAVMVKLNRELSPGEVILIFNRVKQFLTIRELY